MKTYTVLETKQEIRDFLNSLNGITMEMEAKVVDSEWHPFLSSDVQNMLHCPLLGPFTVRVPHLTPVSSDPHVKLRKQYEEDCLWYNEPWKFWEQSMAGSFEPLTAPPSFYRNYSYRRLEPTITMPDGTILPRPVDKKTESAPFYCTSLRTYYRTHSDLLKVIAYYNAAVEKLASAIRGEK